MSSVRGSATRVRPPRSEKSSSGRTLTSGVQRKVKVYAGDRALPALHQVRRLPGQVRAGIAHLRAHGGAVLGGGAAGHGERRPPPRGRRPEAGCVATCERTRCECNRSPGLRRYGALGHPRERRLMAAGPRISIPPVPTTQTKLPYVVADAGTSLQAVRRDPRRRRGLLRGGPRPGRGLPGPQRGRQVHHHADDHPVLRARRRNHPAGRRPAQPRAGARPSGGSATSPRTTRSTPRCWSRSVSTSWPACGASAAPTAGPSLDEAIAATGIEDVYHRPIGELSKGFRQRVGLAAAILHRPDLLVLDEPTEGLDPNQRVEIRRLIAELGRERTVILSTHVLPEVQFTCSRLLIINRGRIVADGPVDDLVSRAKDGARISVEVAGAGVAERLAAAAGRARGGGTRDPTAPDRGATVTVAGAEDLRPAGLRAGEGVGLDALRAAPGGREPRGSVPPAHHRPGAGMRRIWTVARRELRALFDLPTGYILLVVFLAINGVLLLPPGLPVGHGQPAADARHAALGIPLLRAGGHHARRWPRTSAAGRSRWCSPSRSPSWSCCSASISARCCSSGSRWR